MQIPLVVIAIGVIAASVFAAPPTTATQPKRLRIVLVGDSTVTDKDGWGGGLAHLVKRDVEVANFSAGGRSSKSFRDEGKWDKALADGGDYLLIQFGHNDQPAKGPERETDPNTTFKANLLRYVAEGRARGMKPILVTSLVRRNFGPDGKIVPDALAPYVVAERAAAKEAGVPLVDLHERSIAYFEQLGPAECERLCPRDSSDPTKPDRTHLSAVWKRPVAELVADELKKALPELAAHLK